MADTPEVKVKKKIKQLLLNAGAYYAMPIGSGYGNAGVPDFVVCFKGKFIAIEAKANKGKPTLLQLKNLKEIHKTGGLSLIINELNIDYLVQCLNNIESAESNFHYFYDTNHHN
jgi:penicillin-binding protein-related factor A (putative recombinase)